MFSSEEGGQTNMKYTLKGSRGYTCIGDLVVNINIKGYPTMK